MRFHKRFQFKGDGGVRGNARAWNQEVEEGNLSPYVEKGTDQIA